MSLTRQKKGMYTFHSSHQGSSHKKKDKICQDAAYSRFQDNDRYAVAIVSDGHGGTNYFRSDKGAHFAIEAARESIEVFMECFLKEDSFEKTSNCLFEKPNNLMRQLETSIIYRWRAKIKEDYEQNPFSENELGIRDLEKDWVKAYGTTLIVVVIYPEHFWFGIHIGDGKCVAQYADGKMDQPIPWDDKCFLNVTTSLCDENPLINFSHSFHTDNFPTAIFVGSDGVDDCFAKDEDLYDFYEEVIQTFRTNKNFEVAYKEVDAFLPVMSERGSGDDISVSGILDCQDEKKVEEITNK